MRIDLPSGWINSRRFAEYLKLIGEVHDPFVQTIYCYVPADCSIMVDAGTQLLSLYNQLATDGKEVILEFEPGSDKVMGYLDRLGFFDWLDPSIQVLPTRPRVSRARRFAGNSPNVIELIPINPRNRDRTIPGRLADRLEQVCSARDDHTKLGRAAFTLFAEMIDNIYEHSDTVIDGYAALQVYPATSTVLVTVSDSGHGIVDTIRESLAGTHLQFASDPEVIVHLFNEGRSRLGAERGCGLKQCAEHALRYDAELALRLPQSSLQLVPSGRRYQAQNVAFGMTDLPLLHGTHIAFNFRLDKPGANLV